MKPIPQGQEPAGLATYRQNNPQALLDEIKNRQYGLCAYCEIDLKNDGVTVDQLVEHFHPKQDSNQYHKNCQTANIRVDRVQKTIDELGLNCERLRRIRGKVLDEIDELLQESVNPKELISKFLSPIPPTKNTLWPFFTTIRLYFGTEGEKFILQNS